ncbi:MAG: acyl carrier protein, partial [Bacteroidia bacterium]
MKALKLELKNHIINELNLEDITPGDIANDAPIFGTGLELDSIDALELVVILDKFYGIKIPNEEIGKHVFQSIDSMAQYVADNR